MQGCSPKGGKARQAGAAATNDDGFAVVCELFDFCGTGFAAVVTLDMEAAVIWIFCERLTPPQSSKRGGLLPPFRAAKGRVGEG